MPSPCFVGPQQGILSYETWNTHLNKEYATQYKTWNTHLNKEHSTQNRPPSPALWPDLVVAIAGIDMGHSPALVTGRKGRLAPIGYYFEPRTHGRFTGVWVCLRVPSALLLMKLWVCLRAPHGTLSAEHGHWRVTACPARECDRCRECLRVCRAPLGHESTPSEFGSVTTRGEFVSWRLGSTLPWCFVEFPPVSDDRFGSNLA